MKPWLKWWSHFVAAALAFGIVMAVTRPGAPDSSNAVGPARKPTAASGATGSQQTESKIRPVKRTAKEYHAAWEALAAKRLGPEDRIRLQIEILQRWAEVDLDGALTAALAEAWDDHATWSDGIDRLLQAGFGQVFLDRPDDVWRMIRKKQFGIFGSALVRDAWVCALGRENPDLILSYLPEMDGMVFRNALNALTEQLRSPEQANHLWDELAKKGSWNEDSKSLLSPLGDQFAQIMSLEDLRKRLANSSGPLAGVACAAFANKLTWDEEKTDILAEIGKVPASMKSQLAFDYLTRTSATDGGSRIRESLDYLIENEQWDFLKQQETSERVKWLGAVIDAPELAEWVASLPPRAETVEMFHRGIEPYIQKDREAAWSWIAQFDEGMWRDRAYAEYSQQCLRRFKDPGKSREALDRIQDPEFRKTAESWRTSWEKETGWKE